MFVKNISNNSYKDNMMFTICIVISIIGFINLASALCAGGIYVDALYEFCVNDKNISKGFLLDYLYFMNHYPVWFILVCFCTLFSLYTWKKLEDSINIKKKQD